LKIVAVVTLQWCGLHYGLEVEVSFTESAEGGCDGRNSSENPNRLKRLQVFRLFKCAVKDDETLVDAIVERPYRKMKESDAGRTERAVELIVDRDATAGSRLMALVDEILPDRRAKAAA
jgi:hypothetical protein